MVTKEEHMRGTRATTTAPANGRARWERFALAALLLGTALLYLWGLGASGYANEYYAAAVQAGTQSWKAWFFGALDAPGAITVDKPPAALWVMGLSGRIFGFGSWSMLVPQALMGVGSVALLYAAVRRWSGPAAGLFAGAVFALTPVVVLIFRFNNPDALLLLLLIAGAYCMVRACEHAGTKWLILAGVLVGGAFLTKMLQAFIVLPAFVLMYLVAAPTPIRRRIWQVLLAGAALIGSAGWWVAVVSLWPASARPYIGGSTTNSALELALGYNGLSRITGEEGTKSGGGQLYGGPGDSGGSGLGRLFGAGVGEQVAWLLPTALIAVGIGLWLSRRAPRTDRFRASLLLWGGWLVVTAAVYTAMSGKFHAYYSVSLVPGISGVVAVTGAELWRRRDSWTGRASLAVLAVTAGAWSYVLLARTPSWQPWLRYVVAVATVVAVVVLLLRQIVTVAVVAALIGVAGYGVATAAVPHNGADPVAGPAVQRSDDGGKGGSRNGPDVSTPELIAALQATTTKWAAATSGAQSAAPLELATGRPVIGIGGFTGTDPAPTLEQFQQYVAGGQISYFVAGGLEEGKSDSRGGGATQISAWVTANYPARTLGGATVYDLAGAR